MLRLNQGLSVPKSNIFLGFNMSTKRPHSRRSKVQTWVSVHCHMKEGSKCSSICTIDQNPLFQIQYTELECAITTWGRTNQIFFPLFCSTTHWLKLITLRTNLNIKKIVTFNSACFTLWSDSCKFCRPRLLPIG